MRYLAASMISGAVYLVFLGYVYPAYGMFSWVVGIPLVAAPWFYVYRRRTPVPPSAATIAPQPTAVRTPPSHASVPSTPLDRAVACRFGETVACQSCGRSIKIDMPAKDSTGKILLASVDDMIGFALRCRQCDYITCARCALLAYELHNPRQGIPTCPRCGEVAVPFFTEWLAIKAEATQAGAARAGGLAGTPAASPPADDTETQGAVQVLLQAPPTSAGFARGRDAAGKELTCFLIREEADRVERLPHNVPIDVRNAMLDRLGVGVVVVVLRIDGDLYETWWNFHNQVIRRSFEDMRTQDDLLVRFHVDRAEPARTLTMPNPLRGAFEHVTQLLSVRPPWTMERFDAAKAVLAREYPTVQALWDGIAEE